MHKRHIITVVGLFLSINFISIHSAYSQEYKGAVGARFGYGIGVTGIYMFNQSGGHGLEFLLRYGYQGLILNKPGANIQVLYEKHWAFGRNGNWTGYVGAGPAIGFGKKTFQSKDVYFVFGISPIVGIDFTTQQLRVPLVLSFDYKPTMNTNVPFAKEQKPAVTFSYYEIAFSVRIGIK